MPKFRESARQPSEAVKLLRSTIIAVLATSTLAFTSPDMAQAAETAENPKSEKESDSALDLRLANSAYDLAAAARNQLSITLRLGDITPNVPKSFKNSTLTFGQIGEKNGLGLKFWISF